MPLTAIPLNLSITSSVSDAHGTANDHPAESIHSICILLFQDGPIFWSLSDLLHPPTEFCHRLTLEAVREGDCQNSAGQGPKQVTIADCFDQGG